MPNWSLGRTGQYYAKVESAYGTAPTLASTDAFRHLNVNLHFDPRQLTKSPERHTNPSQYVMLTRRQIASFDVKAQWYPSGTLNTIPESDAFLVNGLGGTKTNITLATTVTAAAKTTTSCTLTSAAGLAVGQPIQIIEAGGATPGTYIRWLTVVAGAVVTWAPALQTAPATSDVVNGCIGYPLGTALPASMTMAHYPQSPSLWYNRELNGCSVDKLVFSFDSNLEPMVQFSGPAKGQVSAQTQPVAFTTVGAESAIPSGLTGYFQYGSTLYQIEKMELTVDNAMDLQSTALGTTAAVAMFRRGKRSVTIKVNAKVSDDLTLWTPSLSQASATLMLQLGTVSTKMWGVYCPAVVIMAPPDTPDSDETNNWDFQLTALGTAGNDELYIAAA